MVTRGLCERAGQSNDNAAAAAVALARATLEKWKWLQTNARSSQPVGLRDNLCELAAEWEKTGGGVASQPASRDPMSSRM